LVDPIKDEEEKAAAKETAKAKAKAKAKSQAASDEATSVAKLWGSLGRPKEHYGDGPEAGGTVDVATAPDSDDDPTPTATTASQAETTAAPEPKAAAKATPKAKGAAKRKAAPKAKGAATHKLDREKEGLKSFFEEVNEAWPGVGTEMNDVLAPVLLEVAANESDMADEADATEGDAGSKDIVHAAASAPASGAASSASIVRSSSAQLTTPLQNLTCGLSSFLQERHGVCINFVRKEFTITDSDTRKPLGVLYGLGDATIRGKCAIRGHKCQCFLTVKSGRWEEAFGAIVGWLASGRGEVMPPDEHDKNSKDLGRCF